MSNVGKVLTAFVIIAAILLFSLTATSIFYFQVERRERRVAEENFKKANNALANLREEFQGLKKESFLLQEKNKEADEKINSLLDDLDLEKGLREEIKKENISLKEEVEKEKKIREKVEGDLAANDQKSQARIAEIEATLKNETQAKTELEGKFKDIQQRNVWLEQYKAQLDQGVNDFKQATLQNNPQQVAPLAPDQDKVDLDKIVVAPDHAPKGRILSVDPDTEFVIVNLGEKDGIGKGNLMSVYRGKDYLGDIKVTRVQPEMSAADFIPPFSSRTVRKNDEVVLKQ